MKRILIPTVFHQDTLAAVRLAAELNAHGDEVIITLLTASELSNSITDLLFLTPHSETDKKARELFINGAREIIRNRKSIRLVEHHHYGVSRPKVSQLLERLETDMILVPRSFQESRNYVHKTLLSIFNKLHHPLMLLPLEKAVPVMIQRALYVHEDMTPVVKSLPQLPFHIIHQVMLTETMQGGPLKQVVSDFNIDLVVQSRQGNRVPQNNELTTELSLPVLTV